ncbi:hypothetical protein [Nevskia sp.]|uniref:hypothetical protein n=1 Tax=Nevskia sp. TaxID=1929292 RepID=UPI0025DC9C4E|nr:hypothetical protein [Nevskia sp.]
MRISRFITTFGLTAGLGLSVVSTPATAQFLPGLPTIPGTGVRYGCDWGVVNDVNTNNTGFLDTTATYATAVLPVNPGNGAVITITGTYPRVRYFSFQLYSGFRPGNFVDTAPDSEIIPIGGVAPGSNPAALPPNNNYTNRYQVTIRFEDAPVPPAVRAPNTIYAGTGGSAGAVTKQLTYRTYLPNVGSDGLGGQPLPTLRYVGPDGQFDLADAPDQRGCQLSTNLTNALVLFPVAGVGQGQSNVAFRPISGRGAGVFYPNGDSDYLRAQTGSIYAPLIVIRARLPTTPHLPLANPDVRYYSLCQNQLNNSRNVGCIADREFTLQNDGTFTAVISSEANRPVLAYPQFGYNWLPFGPAPFGLTVLRQILSRPTFEGNFQNAVDNPDAPLTETLGSFAPDITYCDRATFTAFAPSGGAALIAACRANFRPIGGLLGN